MSLAPEHHHEDCDYRNSLAAKETAEMFGVDVNEHSEVFPCNLGCDGMSALRCETCAGHIGPERRWGDRFCTYACGQDERDEASPIEHLQRVMHRASELCNAIDGATDAFDSERGALEDVIADAIALLERHGAA